MLNEINLRSDTSGEIQSCRNLDTARPSGHGLDVTQPIGLEGISNGIEAMGLGGPLVIDLTIPPPFGFDSNNTPPIGVDLDSTFAHYKKPPEGEYTHNYSYELNDDLSRREDPGSPYNYPPNMTFAKRKFNASYGSDQSSLNRTPVKQLKKRGKLEREFFERGRNEQMDTTLNGTQDISGPSDFEVADRTWMPESEEKKDLDKTWKPGAATPSDSDDDYDAEMESTDLQANSLDKTWAPGRLDISELEEDTANTSQGVKCRCCETFFNNKSEMFGHIIAIHGGDDITAVVSIEMPAVCTNCSDQNKPMAFCSKCLSDPYLCNPCVHAHKRVRQTKDHAIIFCSNSNEEDPYVMLENILDSVYPERSSLSKQMVLPDPPQDPKLFVPLRCASSDKLEIMEDELKTIRLKSIKLAEVLNRTTGSETSSESSLSSSSGPSRSSSSASGSSSQNSSATIRVLTEEILADNLLPIFNVAEVDVKTKVAVVMEMLLEMEAVHPSLFCDNRSITGFKSLLMTFC